MINMNKRGDMPSTLLVIVALVVAIALLTTFIYYTRSVVNTPGEISEMMVEVEGAQQYVLAETHAMGMQAIGSGNDVQSEFIKIATSRDAGAKSYGNFFSKIARGEFSFTDEGDGSYLFKMQNVFVQSKKGANAVRRVFDISVSINSNTQDFKDVSNFR